ncbi:MULTISPECIES: hypothetical protein [unclassified Microcoleus]
MAAKSLFDNSRIHDTRHAIDPSRNKKPVSEKLAERISLAQVNSKI